MRVPYGSCSSALCCRLCIADSFGSAMPRAEITELATEAAPVGHFGGCWVLRVDPSFILKRNRPRRMPCVRGSSFQRGRVWFGLCELGYLRVQFFLQRCGEPFIQRCGYSAFLFSSTKTRIVPCLWPLGASDRETVLTFPGYM